MKVMGSSSKAGREKKRELSDHTLTLLQRLREALSLGIKSHDKNGRKWQCTDAEIQLHALRTMSAFIGCISSTLLQHPLTKDSVSDILVALEGILQAENETVLSLATNVTVKLVYSLGSSICQYHILEVFHSLSYLLSFCLLPVAISSAIALNHILKNLGPRRCENRKEVWGALEKTNAVGSIACGLKSYVNGVQPLEYFTEMVSLLKTILWSWPPSRYPVSSNIELMTSLGAICGNTDSSIVTGVIQLYSALALCGDGVMKLLCENHLVSRMVQWMGSSQSQPCCVRIEALTLCQHLTRSEQGCSMLTSLCCEPIVQGIITAMGGWRSCSKKVPTDQMPLVMEACRTALITRWAGEHHSYFWKLGIDRVLLDLLLGNCSKFYRDQALFSSKELIVAAYDNVTDTRPYIWDILGWLAIHCDEDFHPNDNGKMSCLDVLISCACSIAVDSTRRGRCSPLLNSSELEPVSRAVLLMVFSPCKYIASQARHFLSEVVRPDGDEYLEYLLATLALNVTGDGSLLSDKLHSVIKLISLAIYSSLPQYQKLIVKKKGVDTLLTIIKRCLSSDIHVSRSSIASHLHNSSNVRTCCWSQMGEWEGGDIFLFYSLQALSRLIWLCDYVYYHDEETQGQVDVGMLCVNSEVQSLVNSLQYIVNNSFNPGPRWYAAYILSFFSFYGFPSRLGKRMKKAVDENELADLQLILSNGQSLRVHSVILMAMSPSLLPPEESPPKEKTWDDDGSTKKPENEQHGRRIRREVHMSARVDSRAFIKMLEYVYTGFIQFDDHLMKPLKVLAKCCCLKSLSHMLHQKFPPWGSAVPSCNLTQAFGPGGLRFSDIILEATAAEGVAWNCSVCQISTPHIHAHKIILWSSCDYFQALFQSGMKDSYSQIIKVPVGWEALVKLVNWFYSGELAKIKLCCAWKNMDAKQQLLEMQAYVELYSLAEFWFLEDVREASLDVVASCLDSNQNLSIDVINFAANLNQWNIVEVAVSNIAPLYPRMRDAGDLEELNGQAVDMLRAEYVRYSQGVS